MSESDEKSQDYHGAIKSVVDHLKSKRSKLQREITTDELEKARLVGEMKKLEDRLSILNANLRKKSEFRKEYDKAISQSEEHFEELLQKSEDFLSLTRREALALSAAIGEPPTSPEGRAPPRHRPPPCHRAPNPADPPPAVFFIQPSDSDNSNTCTSPGPCATIMVPYRANGL